MDFKSLFEHLYSQHNIYQCNFEYFFRLEVSSLPFPALQQGEYTELAKVQASQRLIEAMNMRIGRYLESETLNLETVKGQLNTRASLAQWYHLRQPSSLVLSL